MSRALSRALRDIQLEAKDASAVELARHYASVMDLDAKQARYLGPRLLEVLVELGMTPKARAAVLNGRIPRSSLLVVGANKPDEPNGLEVLRARHVLRKAAGRMPVSPGGYWPCPDCERSLAGFFGQNIGLCPHCGYKLPDGYPGPSYGPPGYQPPSV